MNICFISIIRSMIPPFEIKFSYYKFYCSDLIEHFKTMVYSFLKLKLGLYLTELNVFTKEKKIILVTQNFNNSYFYSDLQLSVLVQVSRYSHFIASPFFSLKLRSLKYNREKEYQRKSSGKFMVLL